MWTDEVNMDPEKDLGIPEALRKPPSLIERLTVAVVGAFVFFIISGLAIALVSGISIPPNLNQTIALVIGSGVGGWLGYRFPQPVAELFSTISIGR